ncbi:MAG TPA: hypothetical protein VF158_08145 [Longimicrobiales bacterium]
MASFLDIVLAAAPVAGQAAAGFAEGQILAEQRKRERAERERERAERERRRLIEEARNELLLEQLRLGNERTRRSLNAPAEQPEFRVNADGISATFADEDAARAFRERNTLPDDDADAPSVSPTERRLQARAEREQNERQAEGMALQYLRAGAAAGRTPGEILTEFLSDAEAGFSGRLGRAELLRVFTNAQSRAAQLEGREILNQNRATGGFGGEPVIAGVNADPTAPAAPGSTTRPTTPTGGLSTADVAAAREAVRNLTPEEARAELAAVGFDDAEIRQILGGR